MCLGETALPVVYPGERSLAVVHLREIALPIVHPGERALDVVHLRERP